MTQMRLDPKTAQQELTDHPYYRYRGCAPDPDDPKLAAGSPEVDAEGKPVRLPVGAWQAPDVDGGEDQEARNERVRAAKAVCASCPVLAVCAVYGASVTVDGKLAERHSILGARTALERTKALVQERQVKPVVVEPAPDEQLKTEQKLAVLRGLARHADPELVAVAAGLGAGLEGLRTAKWQIARLKTQMSLPKSATRAEVLEAAVARGLLDPGEVADAPPGAVPAVSVSPVQLSFDDVLAPAPVTALFPSAPVLEAAA